MKNVLEKDKSFLLSTACGNGGCINFVGHTDKLGYGKIKRTNLFGKTVIYAHRYAYYLLAGYMPKTNEFVCHRCDNPSCVNPEHLFLSDHKGNMADMVSKGRAKNSNVLGGQKGELNGNSKLTKEQVISIKERISNREMLTLISSDFGVHIATISAIKQGISWKDT